MNEPTSYRITDMAEEERPRERLAKHGAGALSTPELLAILLRVGVSGENAIQVANRLLITHGGLAGLHRLPYDLLCQEHGIGPAKAAQIKAALMLGHRMEQSAEKQAIHSPKEAADLVQFEMSTLEQEELRVILLDTRNRLISIEEVYRGSINSSQVRVGELFKVAIRKNAPNLIVVHNHPSGDPTPSPGIWRSWQGYWPNSFTGSQRSGAIIQESLHAGDYLPSGHPVKGASLRSASLRDFALDRGPTCGKAFRLGSDSFKKTLVFMNWLTTHHP